MITEQDLQEAIAECKGQRNPNSSTCIKLAAFLTIQKELFGHTEPSEVPPSPQYTYAAPVENTIEIDSDTEFAKMVRGKHAEDVWPVMDELMTTLNAVYPRLYDSVIRQLS